MIFHSIKKEDKIVDPFNEKGIVATLFDRLT